MGHSRANIESRLKKRFQEITTALILLVAIVLFEFTLGSLPKFEAKNLRGEEVRRNHLVGKTTILIVTPSRAATEQSKKWGKMLENSDRAISQKANIRSLISLSLPFFLTEDDVVAIAKDKVEKENWDHTWVINDGPLEEAFNIPAHSEEAYVIVLDRRSKVKTKISGSPNEDKIKQVISALNY